MRRQMLAATATAAALAIVTGCSAQPGDLSAAAERVLVPKVQQVRETAANGTYAQLVAKVRQLKALVENERAAGEVSDSRAAAIDDAADTLVQDARPTPSPTPTPSSPSPTPTQSSPTPSQSPSPSPTPSSSESPSPGTTVSIGGIGPH